MMQSLYQHRHCLLSRLMSLTRSQLQLQRMNHTDVEGRVPAEVFANIHSDSMVTQKKRVYMPKCIKVNAKHFGIKPNQIPDSPLTVLKMLRYEGFEAYLVGGCIRDIILDKVPKDFDVITTATLSQINKKFRRSIIIGSRFPICRVVMKRSVIEVSSFETVARHAEGKEKAISSKISTGSRDSVLWRNSMKRDFTINSLFFDPFKNVIYDCANGMEDLRALNLQTVIPARQSFQEDCARILRGLRIAGRLGLSISPDTETAIHELSSSIASLDKFRLMLELNYMLSYGASEASISLLQKFNLLGVFFPFHAAYLHQQSTGNSPTSSIMVMKLLFYLDRLVSCAQPCSSNLWLGVFAFHQALVIYPQDVLVIWAFASTLYHGNWGEGLKFAKDHAKLQDEFELDILRFSESKSDDELAGEVTHFAGLVQKCVSSYVDRDQLSKYMSRYPKSPSPDMVFISKKAGSDTAQLFHVLGKDKLGSHQSTKRKSIIDYKKLGKGDLWETRFVLGKIILETLNGGHVGKMGIKKRDIESVESTSKQGLNKKLKLVDERLEEEGAVKRIKDESSKMTRKPAKTGGSSLPNDGVNRIKGSSLKGEEANFIQKRGIEDDEIVEERYRNGAGKHWVKDGRTIEKMKLENKRDCHIALQDMACKVTNARRHGSNDAALVEEGDSRSSRSLLSSLFRDK